MQLRVYFYCMALLRKLLEDELYPLEMNKNWQEYCWRALSIFNCRPETKTKVGVRKKRIKYTC